MATASNYPLNENSAASLAPDTGAPGLSLVGRLFVWATPFLAVLPCLPGRSLGGMNLGGWVWSALLLAGIGLLCCHHWATPLNDVRQPLRGWMLWVGVVWASLIWCTDPAIRINVQQACQLSMPIVVAIISSVFIRTGDHLRTLLRAFDWSFLPLGAIIILSRMGFGDTEVAGNRDAALSTALIGCICLASASASPLWGYAGWIGCLIMILLSSSRMAVVALTLMILFQPSFRGLRPRLIAAAMMIVIGAAVFLSPIFQQRTFYEGEGSFGDLTQGEGVDTAGRFDTWPLLWDEMCKRPILGSGVGTAGEFTLKVTDGTMAHPHNDYLRIVFDFGVIGLAIYAAAMIGQLLDLKRKFSRSHGVIQQAFAATLLGFLVLLITSVTDNTLIYNLCYMDPLFALMGAAYGAYRGSLHEHENPKVPFAGVAALPRGR